VNNIIDRVSAAELSITQVTLRQHKKTSDEGWEQWFLGYASLGFGSLTSIQLAPDTNFIKRRYASGLLRRLGKSCFSTLQFNIPNLVILEIEALYNRNKKTVENLDKKISESNDRKATEGKRKDEYGSARFKASIEMRESLIATKELLFIRDRGALILQSDIERIRESFSENAGKGFTDMYIRKEKRDAITSSNLNIRFLTCDLMNALAAVSEGLSTFYFARLKSEKYYLSEEHDACLEQLADLIIDTTTTFGEITLYASPSSGKEDSKLLKWNWVDWTIEDLLNDRIIEQRSE
jgi:rRNA-processing protein FCF1